MKIPVRQIAKDGYDLPLDSGEAWLRDILLNIFPNKTIDLKSVSGGLRLLNLSGNVHVTGRIDFDHKPVCARCGAELSRHESVPIQASLIPRAAMTGEEPLSAEEEKELTPDDLDYAFYSGEEVDVGPIVNDEIALALPYNYYCEDKTRCEQTRAEALKTRKTATVDPRWDALKNFKAKS